MADSKHLPVGEQILELLRLLPADASWDDVMYRIYVRQAIEEGIQSADADRTMSTAQVRKEFGLSS